ncbi:AMP-binding protein [Sanguibacter suaedae]|uniref:AMP-binding protein n=1 Tax=Sanguibacter suaedae TaxID=2795737 RepID=A0A934ICC4_9MICO|nr:AMP-binding protein [Sanguibacter suaedae]MBI9115251.1 AMP-binding protein [Sanguibacter suaedae]
MTIDEMPATITAAAVVTDRADRTDLAVDSLAGRIQAHASLTPDAPAVVDGTRTTSYAELLAVATGSVAALPGCTDDRVAVVVHKTTATVALVLGCLVARRPVLLLAPTMLPERRDAVLRDAGILHLVDDPERLATPGIPATSSGPDRAQGPASGTDDALLLTTSGTTGTPKVVPLGRTAIDRFVLWAGEELALGPGTTVLSLAPLNFDISLLDVWATLAAGGRAVLVPPTRAVRGRVVLDLLESERAEVVQAVPTFFRLMIDAAAGRQVPGVREVVLTGEPVDHATVAGVRRVFPSARVRNVYGMTETNDSLMHVLTGDEPTDRPVPVGHPLPGVDVLVHTEDGGYAPFGDGELLVRTPFQADRYLGDRGSAERFVTVWTSRGSREYVRTGDLVRRRPGEPAVLVGRVDRRVKVRGIAVDLADVELVLEEHPMVTAAAVVAETDDLEGHRLAGVVRRSPGSDLDLVTLRRYCTSRLPTGSTLPELHLTDEPFPLTITGKTDRPRTLRAARQEHERTRHGHHAHHL